MTKAVQILVSDSLLSAFDRVLQSVKTSCEDKNADNIIIVPDRYTLNAERLLFERLQTDSLFNVEVLTLTRLVNKTLNLQGVKVLNKQAAIMQIQKILLENAEQFNTFKKLRDSEKFAEALYATISQLQSSNVTSEDLKNNIKPTSFGAKCKDISFVFEKYCDVLKTIGLDATSRLALFNGSVQKIERLQKANVFFAMFDHFTNQQLETIQKLSLVCQSVTIGICFKAQSDNKSAFVNETLHAVLNALTNRNIASTVQYGKGVLKQPFTQLHTNLFAKTNQFNKVDTNQIKVVEHIQHTDELTFAASEIKRYVMEKGYRFGDIAVAINGLEQSKFDLTRIFNSFQIPFYLDSTRTLKENYLAKYYLLLCDLVQKKLERSVVMEYIKSEFVTLPQEDKNKFENYCIKYGKNYSEFFYPFTEKDEFSARAEQIRFSWLAPLQSFKAELENAKTASDYVVALRKVLEQQKAEAIYSELLTKISDPIEKKLGEQAIKKLQTVLDEIVQNLGNTVMTVEYFVQILSGGMTATTLSTVPLKVNSVFVGDVSESMFYPMKVLFVLNCVDGAFPHYQQDYGMITDGEIEDFLAKNRITPSIRLQNKREKMKVLELLSLPSEKLILSYANMSSRDNNTPSDVIKQIEAMFTENQTNLIPLQTAEMLYNGEWIEKKDERIKFASYYFGTEERAKQYYLTHQNEQSWMMSLLKQLYQNESKISEIEQKIDCGESLFFKNKTTKVSQIERYFTCPYMHFLDYGIKCKQREEYEISPIDIGNILHRVAELFVQTLLNKVLEQKDVEYTAKNCFEKAVAERKINKFISKKTELDNLQTEALRLCKAIWYQNEKSEFKPFQTEYAFTNYSLANGYSLSGKVDRIDRWNDYVKLIDYKTGKTKFDFSDVYYGKKIQLPVYAVIMERLFHKKTAGIFYFPSKNSFYSQDDGEFSTFKLSGIYLNEEPIIKNLDTTLKSADVSEIIQAEYTKKMALSASSEKVALSPKQMDDLLNYAMAVLNGAITELQGGNIAPSPLKDSCAYCPYYDICKFNREQKGYRLCAFKAQKQSFSMERKEEEANGSD